MSASLGLGAWHGQGLRVIGRFHCQLRALAFVVISTSQKMHVLSEHNITQAFIINVLTCNTSRRCEVVGNSYARGLQLLTVWFGSQAAASHNPRGSKPTNRLFQATSTRVFGFTGHTTPSALTSSKCCSW